MRRLILALALLATPAGAVAPALVTPPPVAAAPVDPAALAVARQIAAKVWPEGAMSKMMDAMSGQLTGQITNGMLDMPLRDLVAGAGLSAEDRAKLGSTTTRQIMAIMDPAFQQRITIMQQIMMPELGHAMADIEPDMREALSRAYARRFSVGQLGEVLAFFNTPTGNAYAAASMQIAADPDYLAGMQSMMPKIVKMMPAIMAKVKVETDKLPKPRKYEDLTPAERSRIAALIGKPAATQSKSSQP